MKITVTDQLSDCAAKLARYLISESGLKTALKLNGSDPITRLNHKVLYNIYKKKGKYAFRKVLVVMTSDGIKKWNQQFYDILDVDTFITSEEEARQYCKERQPLVIEYGGWKEIWSISLQAFDKTGTEYSHTITSFTRRDIAYRKFQDWKNEDVANELHKVHESDRDPQHEYFYYDERGNLIKVTLIYSKLYTTME